MSEREQNLDSLIESFLFLYSNEDKKNWQGTADPFSDNSIRILAKKIVEKLTPLELKCRDGEHHSLGKRLTKIMEYMDDTERLVKIGMLYEDLEKYDCARENYQKTLDPKIILSFVHRSIENPRSIGEGVNAMTELIKPPRGLFYKAFYKSVAFGKYDLALKVAGIMCDRLGDDWPLQEMTYLRKNNSLHKLDKL